ncbi:hypothetical protein [Hufsiella ginkgonis]|uniref:Acid-shock protein n=1 Tax=Hufsiella ginkgonis TaxID=2695274 RepID=A0A7K1Y3W6_9SPHI|nr:hypothetical protein [Hufsiella ginkgonis]MXV17974.1 hypothetical protein [Hufsiella ginkgonis]
MKKAIVALALIGLSVGAFAQTKPAKSKAKAATETKTAKADTTVKHTKTVKKAHTKPKA